ncbi:MAG: glycosyltransferase [Chloroflexi bacterium]|nr:glycosyltransferase [Chloroflexota bacterium]
MTTRALFLLPSVPLPARSGAQIRNLGLLRAAAQWAEVDAIAFGAAEEEPALQHLVAHASVVPRPRLAGGVERLSRLVRSPLPDLAWRYHSTAFERTVSLLVAERGYDVVQAEGLEVARPLLTLSGPTRVYDAHNAEWALQRRAEAAASPRLGSSTLLRWAYSRTQAARLARYERAVLAASTLALAVSQQDASMLEALGTTTPVAVLPNAVDPATYPYAETDPAGPPTLLFLGKLDYRPNAEGLRWFLEAVLPAIRRGVPAVRLFVVGATPPPWLVAWGQRDPGVAVVGDVDDELPYLRRAHALFIPLLAGGGSRLKALVAMSAGTPVMTTRQGIEGLDLEPGRDVLHADTPREWAEASARLLRSAAMRTELRRAGRAIVTSRYSSAVTAPRLREAWQTAGALPAA